jgi:hypothetical protein
MLNNPAELKKQILAHSNKSGIRKKFQSSGMKNEDIADMGHAFEAMVKTDGWIYLEEYIFRNINLVGRLFDDDDPVAKGETKALVKLIQHIDLMITAKNRVLADEKEDKS